jgi:hypothetical protein
MWHRSPPNKGYEAIENFRRGLEYDSMRFVLRNAIGDVFIRDLKFERIVGTEPVLYSMADLDKGVWWPATLMSRYPDPPTVTYLPMAETTYDGTSVTLSKPEGQTTAGVMLSPSEFYGCTVKVKFELKIHCEGELLPEQVAEIYQLHGYDNDPQINLKKLEDGLYLLEGRDRNEIADNSFTYFKPANLNIMLPEYVTSIEILDLEMSIRR